MKPFSIAAFLALISMLANITVLAQSSPVQLRGVHWGGYIESLPFGYNSRVVNKFEADSCLVPDTSLISDDWRNPAFRESIARLKPQLMRFPGGTAANYWYWDDEVVQVVGDNGQLQTVEICEGSFIDVPESIGIGCDAPNENFTAERFKDVLSRTTTTVSSFLETVQEYRNERGMDVQEIFVLSIFDPIYHVGSPQMAYEFGDLSPAQQRNKIAQKGAQRTLKQLSKLLEVYCDDCESYDGEVLFELGNENFLRRYGIYLPRMDCFDMPAPCDTCFTDVELYADVCEALIPIIRERFPNSKIGLAGGRVRMRGEFWNQPLLDRLGPGNAVQYDAVTIHYYPQTVADELLTPETCAGVTDNVDPAELINTYNYSSRRLIDSRGFQVFENQDTEIWLTEFNVDNRLQQCEIQTGVPIPEQGSLFYLSHWLHSIQNLAQLNSIFILNTDRGAPWFNYDFHVPVTNICMHSLFGYPAVSAIHKTGYIRASGVAALLISELLRESDRMRQVLLTASDEPLPLDDTNSLDSTAIESLAPFTRYVEPNPYNGLEEDFPVPGAFAWTFESDTSRKLLIVNMSNRFLKLDVSQIPGFEFAPLQARGVYTNPSELFTYIDNGLESAHLLHAESTFTPDSIIIPQFGFVVIDGFPPEGKCVNNVINTFEPNSSCGFSPCPQCFCGGFTGLSTADFEEDLGLWSAAGQAEVVSLPADVSAQNTSLGDKALLMQSGSAQPSIVSEPVSFDIPVTLRIRFQYGAVGLNSNQDRIVLAYSTNGGESYSPLSGWQHGIHFQNGDINTAIFSIDASPAQEIQFRIRAMSPTPGKNFYLDNIEISACFNQESSAIIAQAPMGDDFDHQISIYPNPAHQSAVLQASIPEGEEAMLQLTGLDGRVYRQQKLNGNGAPSEYSLSLQDLPPGLYIARVACQSYVGSRKLIVSH